MAKYSVDDDKAIIEVLVSITTNGKTKKGIPYYVYYDLDVMGYRTATTTWKVRH